MNWTPQIPPAAGLVPGSMFQGGNCLGKVRTDGHFPARASAMVSAEAVRSSDIWEGLMMDGMSTKPSRFRDSRYFGCVIVRYFSSLNSKKIVFEVLRCIENFFLVFDVGHYISGNEREDSTCVNRRPSRIGIVL